MFSIKTILKLFHLFTYILEWLIDWFIEWLIDWLLGCVYAVSEIYQPCKGGDLSEDEKIGSWGQDQQWKWNWQI